MKKISRFLAFIVFSTAVLAFVSADSAHAASWTSVSGFPYARYCSASVVYKDKLWILGGSGTTNDVWYSSDGASWSQPTYSGGRWAARRSHSAVVFNDRMYVLGGFDDIYSTYYNDVWWSTDGASWTCATSNAAWSARMTFGCVVYDNKIWVIGGYNGSALATVYNSSDGVNWSQVTVTSGFGYRAAMATMVFDNKMYVVCGYDGSYNINTAYYSTNGAAWTRADTSGVGATGIVGGWAVHDNKMWLITFVSAEYDYCYVSTNAVLYSSTGSGTWSSGTSYPATRSYLTAAVFKNRIYVVTGMSDGCNATGTAYYLSSDIWNP